MQRLDKLRDWWREIAARQVSLEKEWKPKLAEFQRLDEKRQTLERLMASFLLDQNERNELTTQLSSEMEKMRKGESLPIIDRRPMDVAYDILMRTGKPMHYGEIPSELAAAGVVIGGQDPRSTLLAYLSRDRRFAKAKEVKRGVWKLRENK